jgi:DNA-3-methyladenine glycosylase
VPRLSEHPEAPDPVLRLGAAEIPARRAGRAFFLRPTEQVARALLGRWLVRRWRGALYGARIVETEAYLGEGDRAAHSFAGRRTLRVEPMYGRGGLLYVFAVYGMHFCANVVTRRAGIAQAVLIRAGERPGLAPAFLRGPAKFFRAFGITGADSGRDLVGAGEFEIRVGPEEETRVESSPRIGVDYAGEAREWPLRFAISGNPAVSRRPHPSSSTRSPRRAGAS